MCPEITRGGRHSKYEPEIHNFIRIDGLIIIQICQKRRRLGCVIPHPSRRGEFTQPSPLIFLTCLFIARRAPPSLPARIPGSGQAPRDLPTRLTCSQAASARAIVNLLHCGEVIARLGRLLVLAPATKTRALRLTAL